MKDYIIVTDGCSDFPSELQNKYKIKIIPMRFSFGDEEFIDTPDHKEMSIKDFYNRLRNEEIAHTVQATGENFKNIILDDLKQGKDIIYICFSSALSGTYNSCSITKNELEKEYPNSKITVIDSLCASMGETLLVYLAINKKENGADYDECVKYIEDTKLHVSHLFTVAELGTLKRGGRLSATKAFLGSLLNLKPVLHVDNEGRLVPTDKCLGRKQSLIKIISKFEATCIDFNTVVISHGDCEEDANFIKQRILKSHPEIKVLIVGYIGPVIGAHSGPGTIAIYFLADKR